MIIHLFRTDSETVKKFGFFKYNERPYTDDVTQWSTSGERGIGFIFFFCGVSVGFEYGETVG